MGDGLLHTLFLPVRRKEELLAENENIKPCGSQALFWGVLSTEHLEAVQQIGSFLIV